MILKLQKQELKTQVEQFLTDNYRINPKSLSSVTDVVLANWFKELDNGGSHLTVDLIADNIVDIAKRYAII